jgi:ribosomal protein S18 acetylase RimI-like enzyme
MSGSAPRLREARPDDAAAIRALTLGAYEQYAGVMSAPGWAGLRTALLAVLDGPANGERIVAEQDGALVGSVMLFPPANSDGGAGGRMPWPELRLLAVDPAVRGLGVGEALVAECARRARAAGWPALGLYTSDSMAVAIRLYERMGFARMPEHDFLPDGGELVKAYRLDLR